MIKDLKGVEAFLYDHIPKKGVVFPGKRGLERIKSFLNLLDNPQNKLKTIHIAGTSGKSSTACFTSLILKSQNLKVGLTVSPHLIDFRERFQINNGLLSEKKTVRYFNEIIDIIDSFDRSSIGPISYFEILISFAFYIFYKEKVDYAVIETGLGGLYDGTNCIDLKSKIVILTRFGLDHTETLGHTLDKIAYQKAQIIKPRNIVISFDQKIAAKKIIEKIVKKNSASLNYIKEKDNYLAKERVGNKVVFDFIFNNYKINNIQLGTSALYQIENCALALAAVYKLSHRDNFILKKNKIIQALSLMNFHGRMEIISIKNKTVILDGAHNPQKMSAFIKSLGKTFPGRKFNFMVSFKKGKDYKKMLGKIIPFANRIYLTNFNCYQDLPLESESAKDITQYLSQKKFLNWKIISNPEIAFKKTLKEKSTMLIVTGSFYLLFRIYPLVGRLSAINNKLDKNAHIQSDVIRPK